MVRWPPRPEREILEYYERGDERDRLENSYGPFERGRTGEVLRRGLPSPPVTIADISEGAGVHALWLATLGYDVHLRDPVRLQIDQATDSARERGLRLASAEVGEARELDLKDGSVDVALLLGPLYHLQSLYKRRQALQEARRVLSEGGLLAVAAIIVSITINYITGISIGHQVFPANRVTTESRRADSNR